MGLAQEDIEKIQELIRVALEQEPANHANVRYEIDLRERTIRVEDELKHQRELMMEGFKQMDKRFEQVDKRFEQVDKRFEEIQKNMEKRFEQVDKRFEEIQQNMDRRFTQSDKRFDEMGRRLDRFMFWSLGITISVGIFVVTYLK